ncbi:MAG: hypothetical protein KAI66_16935, partial [Lentisphaeria bacterium]|nr:hypothetical protein [Lentisphaeria bacterium]
ATHLRAYDPIGTCTDGQCEYTFSNVECPEGCANDECQGCQPSNCSDLGFECGLHDNGCGQNINCGTCDDGLDCESGHCVATCEHECEGWVCNPCCHDDMVTRCEEQADGCNDIIVIEDCTTKQAEGQYVYTCRSTSCQCRYCCGAGTLCPGTGVSTADCPGGNCCTQECQVDDCYAADYVTVNYPDYQEGCNSFIDIKGHPTGADLDDVFCQGSWWVDMSTWTSDCSTEFVLTTPNIQNVSSSPNPYDPDIGTNVCISISGADVCTYCGIPVAECNECLFLTGGCEASGFCDLVATNTTWGHTETWTYWGYCSQSTPCACSFEDTDCGDTDNVVINYPNSAEGCNSYVSLQGHPTEENVDMALCRGIWWADVGIWDSSCTTGWE